jgi:hypothetical protein
VKTPNFLDLRNWESITGLIKISGFFGLPRMFSSRPGSTLRIDVLGRRDEV